MPWFPRQKMGVVDPRSLRPTGLHSANRRRRLRTLRGDHEVCLILCALTFFFLCHSWAGHGFRALFLPTDGTHMRRVREDGCFGPLRPPSRADWGSPDESGLAWLASQACVNPWSGTRKISQSNCRIASALLGAAHLHVVRSVKEGALRLVVVTGVVELLDSIPLRLSACFRPRLGVARSLG
ncbi:hypothetical protein HNY73_011724 [Argiope bruennichi]|uniref:Uncharacterized protein n=1 Tax=Argiope bruennichi TaxID=94029 RepID=A0A8T0F118_ARGBR|nr:hypothetical protein HNY73_011724 [Argiope bruennichi]